MLPPQPTRMANRTVTLAASDQRTCRPFMQSLEKRPIPQSKRAVNGKTTAYAVLGLPSFSGRATATKVDGAVIVSVELPELDPRVKEDGETLQVAIGAGPVTESFFSQPVCGSFSFCAF